MKILNGAFTTLNAHYMAARLLLPGGECGASAASMTDPPKHQHLPPNRRPVQTDRPILTVGALLAALGSRWLLLQTVQHLPDR